MRATTGTRTAVADPNAVALLSPLDPLIHDRKRLEALYGFHYRWEIYTPEKRRVYGPYVMPIHAGDAIVEIGPRRTPESDVEYLLRSFPRNSGGFLSGHGERTD